MAICALIASEQFFGRRIVEINIEAIREQEFYFAQRVLGSWLLANLWETFGILSCYLHLLFLKVCRIFFHFRQDFFFNYAGWNIPVRTEYNLVQISAEHHGIVSFFTHYHGHIKFFFLAIEYV